jgi:hypothetical protein
VANLWRNAQLLNRGAIARRSQSFRRCTHRSLRLPLIKPPRSSHVRAAGREAPLRASCERHGAEQEKSDRHAPCRALTFTGTPSEIVDRTHGMAAMDYKQIALNIVPGQEDDMLQRLAGMMEKL